METPIAVQPIRPNAPDRHRSPVQTYARITGVLLLISAVVGAFGEFFIPTQLIVSGDATVTARNIVASDGLFRMGFVSYLVEAVCDVSLTLLLYLLLRPVRKDLALLAAFLRLVSTATFAIGEFFLVAPSLILGGADYLKTFSPDQLNTLAYLSIKLYAYGGGISFVFYGVASIVIGYLIYRSGFLPKFLGVLLALSGLGFVARTLAMILAPALASSALLLPTAVAGLALMLWLLVRGIDLPNWQARLAVAGDHL